MKLHEIHGKNQYCGPAALSAAFGISSDQGSAMVRAAVGVSKVIGCHDDWLIAAINQHGGRAVKYKAPNLCVGEFIRGHKHLKHTYIVTAGNHYITVRGHQWTDRVWAKGEILPVSKCDMSHLRVEGIIKIIGGNIRPPVLDPNAALRRRAKKLMAELGVELDSDGCTLLPGYLQPASNYTRSSFPEDDNYCFSWDEVVDQLELIGQCY